MPSSTVTATTKPNPDPSRPWASGGDTRTRTPPTSVIRPSADPGRRAARLARGGVAAVSLVLVPHPPRIFRPDPAASVQLAVGHVVIAVVVADGDHGRPPRVAADPVQGTRQRLLLLGRRRQPEAIGAQ